MEEPKGNDTQNNSQQESEKDFSIKIMFEHFFNAIRKAFSAKNESDSATKKNDSSHDALLKQQIVEQQTANSIATEHLTVAKQSKHILKWYTSFTAVIMAGTIGAFLLTYKSNQELKNEFKSQHQSILQVSKVDTLNFMSWVRTDIEYEIDNMGSDPVKIKYGKFLLIASDDSIDLRVDPSFRDIDFIKGMFSGKSFIDSNLINIYVTKDISIKKVFEFKSDNIKFNVFTKNLHAYFCGDINYINQTTNEESEYFFSIKLKIFKTLDRTIYLNENLPIKK